MLEDSSFAIHPGGQSETSESGYKQLGDYVRHEQVEGGAAFHCINGSVKVLFYRSDLVRIIMNPHQEPSTKHNPAVVAEREETVVVMDEEDSHILLTTSALHLQIEKSPFRIHISDGSGRPIVTEYQQGMGYNSKGEVIAFKDCEETDGYYGFGEKAGFLNKQGEEYTMWNTDVYAPHNPETDPLYQSIPYFMGLRDGKAYGVFFHNSYESTFDMKTSRDVFSFKAAGGQLDYFVCAGPSPKEVLEQYTHLTGRMAVPPKWALGYHQSRYSYESETEVREVVKQFLNKEIPLDALYLDIHYMDGYRVFTFNKDQFADPKRLVQDLKDVGVHVIPIVDPGVKKDPEYSVYVDGIKEGHFCSYLEGDLYTGDVWPGESAFPDFTDERTRKWWGDLHEYYTELGIEGIWNDMNEPAVFNETKTMDVNVMHRNDGDPDTHRALHNLYGLQMGKATVDGLTNQLDGKRPFLLTRAGYAGVQRYAAVWTGDNRSFWEHLQLSLPMVMNLGLSGVAFSGPDVGGFAHDTNAELLTRWTQVGAFTPYFRNHSAIGTVYQEPWQFGETYEELMKTYIRLRYVFMPHLYSLFYKAHLEGEPVMRPLLYEFPEDKKTYNINDQFMLGDNVLIAPILQPSVTDRAVYFPEGTWVDYFNGDVYEGEETHLVHAELDKLPIFVKRGSLLPQGSIKQSTKERDDGLSFHIYAGEHETYRTTFYDDDGETTNYVQGEKLEVNLTIESSDSEVSVTLERGEGTYRPNYEQLVLVVHELQGRALKVNGVELDGVDDVFSIPLP